MGAKVGPYLAFPLIFFPFTQCLNPNCHKLFKLVGFTDGARTDWSISMSVGSVRIGHGFEKTLYEEFLSYCWYAVCFHWA